MTKKDYIAIARVLKSAEFAESTANMTRDYIAREMATMLARDNSRFDRDRFLAACGVK